MCFIRFQNIVCLEHPEDGLQTDLHSVTRTNCPVSLSGLLWGTSHELGPPKLEARVVDVVCNFYSAHCCLYQCSQRSQFSTRSLYRAWTFPRRPSAKIHHASFLPSPHLTRAVFSRFLTTVTTLQFPLGGCRTVRQSHGPQCRCSGVQFRGL